MFIVLANDGWMKIYIDHYRSTSPVSASIYFISLLIVGQYILLNLFIAILIENFEQVSVHQDTVDKHYARKRKHMWSKVVNTLRCRHNAVKPTDQEVEHEREEAKVNDDMRRQTPSLFLFKPENKLRRFLQKVVSHAYFEHVMLAAIVASSIQLAIDNPLNDPQSKIAYVLQSIDITLTCVFALEAAIKIVAFGFAFCGSTSYIRNSWNVLDFIVILLNIISLGLTSYNLSYLKILKLLKVLRPLRVISRNEGLRISIRSLGIAMPGIFNIVIVSLLFHLIFGVIGINYFKGRYFYCEL